MPILARFAFDAFAGNGGVKLNHRFAALDRRIRTTGDNAARLEKTLPSVSAGEPIHSQPARREEQIADRVRWLHRRNDAELCEPRDVGSIYNLRVFDAPARLANFSVFRRNRLKRLLVKIENDAIGAIADCVRFDLDTAAQRFFEQRTQLLGFLGEKTGRVRRVVVRLQQGSATRTERAVEDDFDRALREMVMKLVNCRPSSQEILCIFARTINGIDNSYFYFPIGECFLNQFDVFHVAAGILNFAPAEPDLAIDAEQ